MGHLVKLAGRTRLIHEAPLVTTEPRAVKMRRKEAETTSDRAHHHLDGGGEI